MGIESKEVLKSYFTTGAYPSESQFEDLIDSLGTNSIEHTYAELQNLVTLNKLDVNKNYILTNYVHKYFIENSNSSKKIRKRTIISTDFGYANFGAVIDDLILNMEVTVTKLPEDYSGIIKIGDKATVIQVASNYYFRFSNNMHSVKGIEFEYLIERFKNISEDIVLNDANGKPVLKPQGIINTEVHDGSPYMDMAASENQAPAVEKILLTPVSGNSFATEAKSLTYLGDIIYYDFEDNEVKNDNDIVIGQRNGLIKRRVNETLFIDVNCDWREQKFRRWLLSDEHIDQFININEDSEDNTVMTAYEGIYLFTSEFRKKANTDYFYIIPSPEHVLTNLNAKGKTKEFEVSANNTIKAKDFSIFNLDEDKNPVKVAKCKIQFLNNSVFQLNNSTFNIDLNIDELQQISNSTFTCYAVLLGANNSTLENVITLDSQIIEGFNYNNFRNVNFLSYTSGTVSNSYFENVVFGTNTHRNTIASGGAQESVTWIQLDMFKCRFENSSYGSYTSSIKMSNILSINTCLYFYSNKTNALQDNLMNNCVFNNATLRCLYNNINLVFSGFIIPNKGDSDGWMYSLPKTLNSIELKRVESTGELYYEENSSDANGFDKKIFIWNQEINDWEKANFNAGGDEDNADPIIYSIKVGRTGEDSNGVEEEGTPNDPHLHLAYLRLSDITDLVENSLESVVIQSKEIEGHTHSITISYNKSTNNFNIDNITSESGHTHSASIVGIETAGDFVTLDTNQMITGNKSFNKITIRSGEGGSSTIHSYSNTDANLALPTSSGTLALTSDIPSTSNFVDLESNQTILGEKIFNNNLGVGEQAKLQFYAPDTSELPGAGFGLNLESEVYGVENEGLFIDSALKLSGNLNLSDRNINNVEDITANSFKKTGGLPTQFLKADGSVDSNNYDNYESFNLKTEGIQRTTIQSGDDLNFISGNTNILNVNYQAGGVVRYNIDIQNLVTELQGLAQNWANVKSDWNATSGDTQILNKPNIPVNISQLNNDVGYITSVNGGNFLRNDQNGTLNGTLTINKDLIINGDSQAGLVFYRDQEESGFTNSIWIAPRNDSNTGWDYERRFGFYETERRWCVEGDYIVTGNVIANNFQLSSDKNLKENITPISEKDYINVDWKSFNMKSDETKSKRYGVIAQELEETNPELVKTDAKGEKSVSYIDLLVAKIAELESRIKELENK